MRIIDKNHDFYDYMQDPTDTLVFDRAGRSFMLTKEHFCHCIDGCSESNYRFVLMQVGVTYWLFLIKIIARDNKFEGCKKSITDYTINLLHCWKNYNKPTELILIIPISFSPIYTYKMKESYRGDFSEDKIKDGVTTLIEAIDRNDINTSYPISHCVRYKDYKGSCIKESFDIPIIAPCGIGNYVDPDVMFYAIEEYFSIKKMASEKTVADGTTNLDKISSHGFDTKTSFRGYRNKTKSE